MRVVDAFAIGIFVPMVTAIYYLHWELPPQDI